MKRFIPKLLVIAMLVSSIPMSNAVIVNAATEVNTLIKSDDTKSSSSSFTDKNLESIIKAVKSKITVPSNYSEFDYYIYSATSADAYWTLTWRNPSDDSYINVRADQNAHITFYGNYDYSKANDNRGIPTYLKKELKDTADKFIKQIAPEIISKLEYVDATYSGIYENNYIYQYQRVENKIALPENNVTVAVNAITGKVNYSNINWLYDIKVPSSDTKISKEEATKLIKDNMKMRLVYRSNYIYYYTGNTNPQKAFLVYEPTTDYISVDAKTGKVYLTKSEWMEKVKFTENDAKKDGATATADAGGLTREEVAKVEELKNLISKEDAIKKVSSNKYLEFDKSLTSSSATLNKVTNSNGKTSYLWQVNFNDPRPVDYSKKSDTYRAYAYAQVDAQTGKIVSYYTSLKSNYDEVKDKWNTVKVAYNKDQSKAVLEKFLKSEMKNRFDNSTFVGQNDDYVAYIKNNTPVYGGYSYQYNRVNEGIEYPYNGIYGAVNGVSGKIYSLYSNWDDSVVFESSKGAMSADKALEYYLSKHGYDLVYEINQINLYDPKQSTPQEVDVKPEIRLVYYPGINPSYISPFTGDQLNVNGEVFKETKPYQYQDIADTKENRMILLLADMNIGFDGDKFQPNKEITNGELIGLLEKIGYGYSYDRNADKNKLITREELAYNFIAGLGLTKVAALNGIYQTGFTDQANINTKYLGAVALAKGLGIFEGDQNNYFYPNKNVTRLEAVNYMLSYINAQKISLYY